jgi:hypothetical protein
LPWLLGRWTRYQYRRRLRLCLVMCINVDFNSTSSWTPPQEVHRELRVDFNSASPSFSSREVCHHRQRRLQLRLNMTCSSEPWLQHDLEKQMLPG